MVKIRAYSRGGYALFLWMGRQIVVCRSAAANARVTLSNAGVHHPMDGNTVNCCLYSYQLSFRGERKLQRTATKGRTYGSPLDSNSLVTLAVPRYERGTATACYVSANADSPPLRRSALGLMKKPFRGFLLVKTQSFTSRICEPTVLTANGNGMLIFAKTDNADKSFSHTRNFSPYMSLPRKVRTIASTFEEILGAILPTSHLSTGAA